MFSKSVKSSDHRRPKRIKNKSRDRRIFSNSADRTDKINANNSARPMRGGIRL